MKKILTIAIALAASFIAVPEAEARPHRGGHTYVSGHTSCGCPVYRQRYVAYYDSCGHPVFRTRTLPVSHGCRHHHADRGHRYDRHDRDYRRSRGHHRGYHETPGIRIGPVFIPRPGVHFRH